MPSTATITITGTIEGTPEGSESVDIELNNSTSVGTIIQSTFTSGVAAATTAFIPVPPNARFALITLQRSASTVAVYLAGSTLATTATAVRLASSGAILLPVVSTAAINMASGPTSFVLWTT